MGRGKFTSALEKPLPSKGDCMFVYLAVVAHPQYVKIFTDDIYSAKMFWNDR
jgi:hypothetical protein